MMATTPKTIPAFATPRLSASPRLTRPLRENPTITAARPRISHPAMTDKEVITAMIAITNAATPSPLRGFLAGPEESRSE